MIKRIFTWAMVPMLLLGSFPVLPTLAKGEEDSAVPAITSVDFDESGYTITITAENLVQPIDGLIFTHPEIEGKTTLSLCYGGTEDNISFNKGAYCLGDSTENFIGEGKSAKTLLDKLGLSFYVETVDTTTTWTITVDPKGDLFQDNRGKILKFYNFGLFQREDGGVDTLINETVFDGDISYYVAKELLVTSSTHDSEAKTITYAFNEVPQLVAQGGDHKGEVIKVSDFNAHADLFGVYGVTEGNYGLDTLASAITAVALDNDNKTLIFTYKDDLLKGNYLIDTWSWSITNKDGVRYDKAENTAIFKENNELALKLTASATHDTATKTITYQFNTEPMLQTKAGESVDLSEEHLKIYKVYGDADYGEEEHDKGIDISTVNWNSETKTLTLTYVADLELGYKYLVDAWSHNIVSADGLRFAVTEGAKDEEQVKQAIFTVEKSKVKNLTITATAAGNEYLKEHELPNEEGVTVTLETATEDAEIYYTLGDSDFSTENRNRTKYTGEFLIKSDNIYSTTKTLKVIAIKDGYADSDVAELKISWAKKSTGGSSSGGSSSSTTSDTSNETPAETTDTPTTDVVDTTEALKDMLQEFAEENENNPQAIQGLATAMNSANNSNYDQELKDAYTYAFMRGITTMGTIQQAELDRGMTRAEMAKMMAEFAQKVLDKKTTKTDLPKYADISEIKGDLFDYIQLAYQLQIMGIDAEGNPIENFNPHGLVSRAEFATVLSRILFGNKHNQTGADFYTSHLNALKEHGVLKNINPEMQELRGWVMLMLMRTESKK